MHAPASTRVSDLIATNDNAQNQHIYTIYGRVEVDGDDICD